MDSNVHTNYEYVKTNIFGENGAYKSSSESSSTGSA